MASINKCITINAPVEQIQIFLNDIKQFPLWYRGIDELQPELGFPTRVGTASAYTYTVAGMKMTGKLTVVKEIPLVERHIKVDGMISGLQKWVLNSDEDGTRICLLSEYEISRALLEKLPDRLFIEQLSEKYAEESLAVMKLRIET